ncbi:MAG: SLATT domain-containing protein [Phycisphaerales bacterium]|nr:SLATT domain-containing protein [Phycisphaerales bacterium]
MSNTSFFSEKIIAFSSTTISILLLTFSQLENAKDYKLRANQFHDCALKLSEKYNELRAFKTFENTSELEKKAFSQKIGMEYQSILGHFTNHEPIDYALFKAQNYQYFEMAKWDSIVIKFKYYIDTKLIYHSLILVPPILVFSLN